MPEEPEDGRRTVAEETILNTIAELEPQATTPDIAQEIGLTPQGTGYRLRNLEEEGKVESDTIGTANLWFLSESI